MPDLGAEPLRDQQPSLRVELDGLGLPEEHPRVRAALGVGEWVGWTSPALRASHSALGKQKRHPSWPSVSTAPSAKTSRNLAGRLTRPFGSS